VSSSQNTRMFYSPHADRDGITPKPDGFSVVEPAARTTLFPAHGANVLARIPPEPARKQSEPGPGFAAGGTLIMSVPDQLRGGSSPHSQTRQFSVEQLLLRRAEYEREQERNRELALLTPESETPLDTPEVQQTLDLSPQRAKPSIPWLRLCMLGVFLASVALLLYKPAAEPAPSRRSNPLPAPPAASEAAAPTEVAPPPAAAVVLKPRITLQRAATDLVAEGRYPEALPLYRQLAKSEPENSAYAEVVQILERRIASTTKAEPAPP
jgi:tetratricopeptide (TPR) repeat protein